MAFPSEGWPPQQPSSRRSLRLFIQDVAPVSGLYADSAFLFFDQTGANPYVPAPLVAPGDIAAQVYHGSYQAGGSPSGTRRDPAVLRGAFAAGVIENRPPPPVIFTQTIRIFNDGGIDLEFSFDGISTHGIIKPLDPPLTYRHRYESGIAFRCAVGSTCSFRLEGW